MVRVHDFGDLAPLRFGIVLERPGKRPKLVATFAEFNEAVAYALQRRRAEERVSGRSTTGRR